MKSKSYDPRQKIIDQVKENKSFEFVGLYKTAAETINEFDTGEWSYNLNIKPGMTTKKKDHMRSHKRKKGTDSIELPDIAKNHSNSSVTDTNVTSNVNDIKPDSSMKSIMKNKLDNGISSTQSIISSKSKPKKRSKSVSFMLEVSAKKSKPDTEEKSSNKKQDKHKAHKKLIKDKKELDNGDTDKSQVNAIGPLKKEKIKDATSKPEEVAEVMRKVKKAKKFKAPPTETVITPEEGTVDNQTVENKKKKNKKKRKAKGSQDTNTESEEPVLKQSKKELKPEVIAVGLENLNIGDNPHTLTNLLDEMTVVDKKKKNKDKRKHKKDSKDKKEKTSPNECQDEADTIEEVEKVKWKNRKWNKDTKRESESSKLLTALVVDNLPLKIMCNYKTRLAEHFNKFGTISGIGVAEAFPNDDPNPVFTTTIYFKDSEAATKALEEDNTLFEGNRIRVRRPLPPYETTIVIRAYAEMTDQALSSIFSSAGRIRSIRHLIKGKKSISTAFVEFDGPEAVDRAFNMASETKINGKKMYAARYENRNHSHSKRSQKNNESTENDNGLHNSSE